jgi:chromosome partitioning related protein ParA
LNEVINRGGRVDADCISKVAYNPINPNGSLDIILCNASAEIENWLLLRGDRDSIVKRAMRSPIVAENYDVVIIDTRGTEGQPLQCSAAMAADVMLSPISPDTVSAKEFVKGTLGLLERLNQSSDMIPELRTGPMIAFINKMDKSNDAKQVAQAVRDNFRTHPNIKIMDTVVPQWATFKSASTLAQPVHRVDERANLVMHELVWEIFPNLRAQFAENLVDTDVGGHSA